MNQSNLSVTLTRRKNLGNYEHAEASITIGTSVAEGADIEAAIDGMLRTIGVRVAQGGIDAVVAKPATKPLVDEPDAEKPKRGRPRKAETVEEPAADPLASAPAQNDPFAALPGQPLEAFAAEIITPGVALGPFMSAIGTAIAADLSVGGRVQAEIAKFGKSRSNELTDAQRAAVLAALGLSAS